MTHPAHFTLVLNLRRLGTAITPWTWLFPVVIGRAPRTVASRQGKKKKKLPGRRKTPRKRPLLAARLWCLARPIRNLSAEPEEAGARVYGFRKACARRPRVVSTSPSAQGGAAAAAGRYGSPRRHLAHVLRSAVSSPVFTASAASELKD